MNITVINGPNLNMLGKREAGHYGTGTLAELESGLRTNYPTITFTFFQSNDEGDLIDYIQGLVSENSKTDAVIANFGGYTHTSVAIRDALAILDIPVIEVHLSNIHARESFRHQSLTAGAADGVIAGFGFLSYQLAVDAARELVKRASGKA